MARSRLMTHPTISGERLPRFQVTGPRFGEHIGLSVGLAVIRARLRRPPVGSCVCLWHALVQHPNLARRDQGRRKMDWTTEVHPDDGADTAWRMGS